MRTVAAVVAFVACVHAGLWYLSQNVINAPDVPGQLASVSYAPFAGNHHPDTTRAAEGQIRSDLKVLAPMTRAIRTYSATGGVELVPPIANEYGLRVTAGAWLDKDKARNEREIKSVIELARRNSNISSVVVGNETIYRDDLKVPELIQTIQRVKRAVSVPVTTGEIWSVWRDHPELVSAVDYIAVHILPYWEGVSERAAVDAAIGGYDTLRRLYPGKRIVIAEFGWPSAGYNFKNANPGRLEQAEVLRTFAAKADAYGIDYNIVEAIDQPWKTNEGSVGAYWGMYDAARQAKFSWVGPLSDADHWKIAGIALLLGLLLSIPVLAMSGVTAAQAMLMVGAANVAGYWFATVFAFWTQHYLVPGAVFALGLGVVLLIPLVAIMLSRIEEISAVAFGGKPLRLITGAPPLVPQLSGSQSPAPAMPKVSIHVPAHNEPPEMLRQTLDSLARLDYPNFECLVVCNNTTDPALTQPIAEHCALLGERFKFLNLQNVKGFKAGALRIALDEHTAPDAEIIGVIDADYVVDPGWLKDLVPAFADPKVALVQAPQDHRDANRSLMHHAMNGEYAGFFDIGMVQRNEVNAIVVHGTMCLVRRSALVAAGGWPTDTICEDTDLGLTLFALGWQAHYTNKRYGRGLLPENFDQYKKQRHRWAYGGFQIIKKHWRDFLPGRSRLTRDQKREFAVGWLNWLGAETLGVVVAMLNLIWVPFVAFLDIAVPDKILTIPIIASFVVSVMHFASLYRLRVPLTLGNMATSVFAAMSVQWTVARAVGFALVKDHLPFVRTAKGNGAKAQAGDFKAFWEAVIAALLIAGAAVLSIMNVKQIREIDLFAAVLLVQSLPFISAVLIALVERSRFNDFAYWRGLEAHLLDLMPKRPAIAKLPAASDQQKDLVP